MYKNGFIIKKQEKLLKNYSGVDGEVWPLEYVKSKEHSSVIDSLNKYLDDYINDNWSQDLLECINDIEFINKYIEVCNKLNIKIDVIFCESNNNFPICNIDINDNNFKFIGYDYSYNGGSYYSALYNDVCTDRIEEFRKINLNEYGLLNNIEDIHDFISKREELKKVLPMNMFELGDFIILKLWKFIGNHPINL